MKDNIFHHSIHLFNLYLLLFQLCCLYCSWISVFSFTDSFYIINAIIIISDVTGCTSIPNPCIFNKSKNVFPSIVHALSLSIQQILIVVNTVLIWIATVTSFLLSISFNCNIKPTQLHCLASQNFTLPLVHEFFTN